MSVSLLVREPPLVVLPSLAKAIGLNPALLLQQIHFRSIETPDGWVQRTRRAWLLEFPWWTTETVKDTLSVLRDLGLIDAEYVQTATGREPRYRVVYDQVDALEGVGAHRPDPSGAKAPTHRGRTTRRRSFKGEREQLREEKPASQSSPSTVLDEDRDELMERRLRDSIVLVLAEQLAEAMVGNNPRARVAPRSRAWLEPIRLLLDKDGYEPSAVRAMILWSQADDFERSIVLSPRALRKGHERIVQKMRRAGAAPFGGGAAPQASAGALIDAMVGRATA